MSYQKVTGSLMANSHPGSYCGQDAYNDMFVTEERNDLCTTGIWSLQGIEVGISAQNEGLERCHRPCNQTWGGENHLENQNKETICMGSTKGHAGISEEGVSTTLNAQKNEQPVINDSCRTVVRRLTPLECERLQGYPDGWTDIGEWTDTNGKVHKESTDSARYKALGNSIALPFWKVLARRICSMYDRDITMGSLFDGIGGFPFAFEWCGAKAVWASEIEEFPIAVTKRRFPEDDATDINVGKM
jgi:site-specific DNA-cytosine methylase